MNAGRRLMVAAAYGIVCHGTFALAVTAMMFGLWSGMTTGFGRLQGPPAWVANLALLLQFPLLHSGLLSGSGRRVLARLAPRELGKDLAPTSFAIIAALQVLMTFLCWSPSGIEWWRPHDGAAALWAVLFALSWLLLVKALSDGDLRVQTGWIGWRAVWTATRPRFGPLPTSGLFAICRQPIYLGFAATLWTGPVWTPDHLVIAVTWTSYCILGPLHKERRFALIHGERFVEYRRLVPYMMPRIPR